MPNKKKIELYGNIDPNKVFEELVARKYIDNIFSNMLSVVHEMPTYTRLREIALLNFSYNMTDENKSQPVDACLIEKKSRAAQIGLLCDTIGSIITKLFSEKFQSIESDIRTEIMKIIVEVQHSDFRAPEENIECNTQKRSPKRLSKSDTIIKKQTCVSSVQTNSDSNITSDTTPTKRLSQRVQKPNTRYFSKEIVSSLMNFSSEEDSDKSQSDDTDEGSFSMPRKKRKLLRGRV